jgi:ferredoxin-NADP reductase/mono/diheme cytochrome c family protein
MLNSSISVWLGVAFVLIGAINVCLILQVSARVRDTKASTRLVAAHRIGGYLFIALFCVMGYFMVARLADVNAGASSGAMIHLTLAMVLSPLIFVKVLIARYYKSYYSLLMPIGLVIFVLSFVLIGITAGPELVHQSRMQTVSLDAIRLPPAAIDLNRAAATMEKRCTKCHNLDRIAGARKDARGWLATVDRMRALPDSGISEEESRTIVSYLASEMAPKGPGDAANLQVGRALVDQRCGRCHSLDRVYKTVETPDEWRATVAKMVDFADGSANAFHPGEDQQILAYLSATQTSEAIDQRKAQATAAASAGQSVVEQSPATDQPVQRSHYDSKMIAFFSLVCLGTLTLIVRRPARIPLAGAGSPAPAPARVVRAAESSPSGPTILRLASITPQTEDSKTLRFILPHGRKLSARPGQFLTFSLLFDGKKIIRSYSICSSPARSGYVEITTKRVSQGCASVFLNDRASVGMTVEASGAFGQFYFDETRHQNIVLLAAGSGITPMMAMLRYMDDLCLETTVTLLYCVRTSNDIIFRNELEALQTGLKNFQYHVLLSQPHGDWSGRRGHINREFIEDTVMEPASADFFICGPPPFMDASRNILIGMGVRLERIMQESFGSSIPKNPPPNTVSAEPGARVEFFRSGKTCSVRPGQTVLEAAEEHGIAIPSSCRQGQCGTCKTRLLEGNVRMDSEVGLDPDSKAQGFVLTCVGHAVGDIKLDA